MHKSNESRFFTNPKGFAHVDPDAKDCVAVRATPTASFFVYQDGTERAAKAVLKTGEAPKELWPLATCEAMVSDGKWIELPSNPVA